MPSIRQIELPSGTVYDIQDARVDSLINRWEYVICTSAENTPYGVTWGAVTGTLVATADTMYKIYLVPNTTSENDNYLEYITVNSSGSTYKWETLGSIQLPDLSGYVSKAEAGNLAYKDTASGSGTVAVPKTYTTTVTPVAKDVSVTGTTAGSITPTKAVVAIEQTTGTATYTPAGSVAAPTISVATAGTTGTINEAAAKTVVTDISVGESGAAAQGELVYYEVSGSKLSLKKLIESVGDSITTTSKTFKTGDASYSATAPAFTGTGARLVTNAQVMTDASFTGASMTSTGSYTPATPTATTTTATTEDKTVSITVS